MTDKKEENEEKIEQYDRIFYKNADIVIAFRVPKEADEEE